MAPYTRSAHAPKFINKLTYIVCVSEYNSRRSFVEREMEAEMNNAANYGAGALAHVDCEHPGARSGCI